VCEEACIKGGAEWIEEQGKVGRRSAREGGVERVGKGIGGVC